MKITITCLECGKKFNVIPYRVKTHKAKYCSLKCKYKNMDYKIKKGEYRYCLNCNKKYYLFPTRVKRKENKFCSIECRVIGNLGKFRGNKSWNWKGGLTPINFKIRNSYEYIQWSKNIKKRDNFTCQICGIRGGILRSNHIKKFSDYPDLRMVLLNGITICKKCDLKFVLHHEEDWESYFYSNLKNRGLFLKI